MAALSTKLFPAHEYLPFLLGPLLVAWTMFFSFLDLLPLDCLEDPPPVCAPEHISTWIPLSHLPAATPVGLLTGLLQPPRPGPLPLAAPPSSSHWGPCGWALPQPPETVLPALCQRAQKLSTSLLALTLNC